MLYCFLDTNIFIHCQDITNIDWNDELGASEVCLVIAPVVFEELDVFKDDPRNMRKRDRAREAISLLESKLDSKDHIVRKGVTLTYAEGLPHKEFGVYNLAPGNNDDRLVASAIQWTHRHSDNDLILISHDSGPRLKAKQRKMQAKRLSDKYRLPDKLDSRQKEIKRLEKELSELQTKQANLKLGILNQEKEILQELHVEVDCHETPLSRTEQSQF